ncbi:hypothetical protein ACFL5L_03090 [candidate division KSB1 bacterium]
MDEVNYIFPFGQLVIKRIPEIFEQRQLYILGAYPSALHVYWNPPAPYRTIKAIAVDNEPDIFWSGQNEEQIIAIWKKTVAFDNAWGSIRSAGIFNGSSGLWIDNLILSAFKILREETWFSDCLDTYHCSKRLSLRLEDTYRPFAKEYNLPLPHLPSPPSENEIVKMAIDKQLERIKSEMREAKPEIIVSLGNAALRVLSRILHADTELPKRLFPPPERYGIPIQVRIPGNGVSRWFPLAHPGSPRLYQNAHERWLESHGS